MKIPGVILAAWLLVLSPGSMATAGATEATTEATELICATVDVTTCYVGGNCTTGTPENNAIPRFFRLDLMKNTVRVTRDDQTQQVTNIKQVTRTKGRLILQGVESGIGWTLSVTESTGIMSLVGAGEDLGIVITGACTPL